MLNFVRSPCDESVMRAQTGVPPCARTVGRWVLVATIGGSSMAFIDSTVVNVALPVLQNEFAATVSEIQWIVESYALLLAALILVGGSLGDSFGRRRVFGIGVVIFTLASIWCGLAPGIAQLIAARAAQGIGGALLVPGSLAIISTVFGDADRGRAIGIWSAFSAITMAAAPVLGGWLVESLSWRWIFFINVPLGLIVLAIVWRRVPESRNPEATGLDWPGAVLTTLGLGGIVYGLVEASIVGFGHWSVLGALGLGAVALAAFPFAQVRSSSPMVPLALFRSPTFSGANLLTLLLYAALGGALFFLPFSLIQVHGYTVTAAGAAFVPMTLLIFALSGWMGRLADRHGARRFLIIGPFLVAVGFGLFAFGAGSANYWTGILPAVLVLGLGMALVVTPLTTAVMGAVSNTQSGVASGINNAISRTGGLLAVAGFSLLLSYVFNDALDDRLDKIALSSDIRALVEVERFKLAAATIPTSLDSDIAEAVRAAIDHSFITGVRTVMALGAGLALASVPVAWFAIDRPRSGR